MTRWLAPLLLVSCVRECPPPPRPSSDGGGYEAGYAAGARDLERLRTELERVKERERTWEADRNQATTERHEATKLLGHQESETRFCQANLDRCLDVCPAASSAMARRPKQ